ncbi:hypothetical protein VC83_04100 [Pseudogymnoascus destructans]|uniref:Uncharacterized protein n=1 Tax=Pseudogymnoascus destructans TaxID=655981 RepID=A0A177AEK3_9PEZI|nr:uncharacterized protein VC83_04100 [Pseudogymnoascus destructans]OAF59691.1 hypothetical protein VC83_04100 [Pseudogymnoascus destructans]
MPRAVDVEPSPQRGSPPMKPRARHSSSQRSWPWEGVIADITQLSWDIARQLRCIRGGVARGEDRPAPFLTPPSSGIVYTSTFDPGPPKLNLP